MLKSSLLALPVILVLTFGAVAASGIGTPSLFFPIDNAYIFDNTPHFEWSTASGAENYEIQCSKDSSFLQENVFVVDNITSTYFDVENSLPDNRYYWKVRAGKTNGENGPWSQTRPFTIDTIPLAAPSLVSPENGVYFQPSSVSFTWAAVSGASGYRLMVDDVEAFSSTLENIVGTGLSYTRSSISEDEYYWKVASRDLVGNENYSEVWDFIVDNSSPTVSLLTPEDGENTNGNAPQFTWSADDDWGLENYEIWVDNVLVYTENDVTTMEHDSSALSDGLHTWHVRAFDLAGNSGSSSEFSFYVDTVPPSTPAKAYPDNGKWFSSTAVSLRWAPASDRGQPAPSYELWVDNDPDFGSPTLSTSLTDNGTTTSFSDGTYYWRVRASDSASNYGSFENAWSFTVDNTVPPTPSIVSPEDGSFLETIQRPTLSWEAVSDVAWDVYELQVDDDNNFSSAIFSLILENTSFTSTYDMFDDTYYWRVRAIDNFSRAGDWSDNIEFEILYRDFSVTGGFEIQVEQGGLASHAVPVTALGRFTKNVQLSATGQPSDVSVTFSGGGHPSFTATVYAAPEENADVGDYTVTIVGLDSAGWERTASFELKVLQKPLTEISHISAGETVTVSAGRDTVLELEVLASSATDNVSLYLWSAEAPESTPQAGLIYSYFNLGSENLENQLDSLTIKFWVDRSWLEQNNVDLQTVKLMRYSDGDWQELSTQQSGESASSVYFSASSPGFSTFAIVAEQKPGPPAAFYLVPVLAVAAGAASWFFFGRSMPSYIPEVPEEQKKTQGQKKTKPSKRKDEKW